MPASYRRLFVLVTPHGNNWRGSLRGPKIIIPHNCPTIILYPSNFHTMLSLLVFCLSSTNFRAVTPLIYVFLPIPHNLPSILFTPTQTLRYLLPPGINNHITPHHTSSIIVQSTMMLPFFGFAARELSSHQRHRHEPATLVRPHRRVQLLHKG